MANTARITGASSGVSAKFAKYDAQQGGDVAGTDLSGGKLRVAGDCVKLRCFDTNLWL